MPIAALACAALLRAAAAASLGYDVTLHTEGRMRTLHLPASDQADEALEGEVAPRAVLRLLERGNELALRYEPRLTLGDRAGERATFYHQGQLAGIWNPDPLWRLTASAEAAQGDLGFLEFLARPAADGSLGLGQRVPSTRAVAFERLQLGLGAAWQPEPRLQARLAAEYGREGGRGAEARLLVPRSEVWQGRGVLEWRAERETLLSATATGQRSLFEVGPDAWALQLGGSWRRQLDRETAARLGLGLARSSADRALLPTAEAGLAGALGASGARVDYRLEAGLAPFVDRLAATVAQRAAGALWLSWSPGPEWRIEAGGAAAVTVQGPRRDSNLWSGELRGARRFRDLLEVGLGVRALRQRDLLRAPPLPTVPQLLRDRAVFAWVGLSDRGWLWQ